MNQPNLFNETEPTFGDELDFYETPEWAIEAVLPLIPRHGSDELIEPAAGRGALLGPLVAELQPRSALAIEMHHGRFAELHAAHSPAVHCLRADFLTLEFIPNRSRLVVMNPPYTQPRKTIGLEFVEKAISIAGFGAVVALLPLDFATGVERCERVHDHHACSVYPLRRRPHFGGPHSGARPFAWFVWDLLNPKRREWRVIG